MAAPNYTLGRGKIYFSRFNAGTTVPIGFRYMGNSPEFSLSIESENLDHFSSDAGIREKDDSVPIEVTRSGTLVVDDIQTENVALFFYGTTELLQRAALTNQNYSQDGVQRDMFYQIGLTPSNPVGVRKVTNVIVKDDTTPTPITYTLGADYTLDADRGMIYVVPTGAITNGKNLRITYDAPAVKWPRVLSGSAPVEGAMRYIEANPRGQDHDVFLPYVKITPNGDFAFKGDDWRQIPFAIEVLKLPNLAAIYRDGIPELVV